MTKRVYMFGPHSLDQALRHVQSHGGKDLVLLKAPDRRIAVCGANTASELKAKGFTPIDAGR